MKALHLVLLSLIVGMAVIFGAAAKATSYKMGFRHTYKLVVLGETSVGKSSLVLRFVKSSFADKLDSTMGASFFVKNLTVDEEIVRFQIWDTAGQERYNSLAPMYYRGAEAALLVFDISDRDSYYRAQRWAEELWREISQKKVIMLIGNKVDLESLRQVSTREAQAWAEENQMTYIECSAKTGRNINEIFIQVAQRLVDANPERSDPDRQNSGSDRESLDITTYGKKSEEDDDSGRRGRKCCYSG